MLSEEVESYRPPKTAKMFVTAMQAAFLKKDGDKMAKEMRQFYFTNDYAGIPEKNWHVSINPSSFNDGESNLGSSFAKMLELIRDYAMQRAGNRWSECFEKHMQVLIALLKVL